MEVYKCIFISHSCWHMAKGMRMHRWLRVCWNHLYTSCVIRFLSLLCDLCDSDPQYHIPMVHISPLIPQRLTDWNQFFSVWGFPWTQQKSSIFRSCQGHDLQLVNNGQAANNEIAVIQLLRAHGRLMTQCSMHATKSNSLPASKVLNSQFLRVKQQQGAGCRVSGSQKWFV